MVILIAMAALAIDLTTLYVARGEMQRTADAAALAAAKAMVDSGVTNNPSNGTLQTIATTLATHTVNAILAQDTVGGVAPTLVAAISPNFSSSDVQLTVQVQRTNIPTFFGRIWVIGRSLATVSAAATAEAYNPSGHSVPVAPKCVKPWIVANANPQDGGNTFINAATGAITNPDVVVGENIKLCLGSGGGCMPSSANLTYVTALVTLAAGSPCPACDTGKNDYQESIDCCNNQVYSCGETITIDTAGHGTDTGDGVECLIHATGPGAVGGQDTLDNVQFLANDGPLFVKAGDRNSLVLGGTIGTNTPISTSDSMVTLLVANATTLPASGTITIAGFMRAFVEHDDSVVGGGDIQVTFVNVAGCSSTPSGTPVSGGGVSAIPVRLIHP